MILLNVIDNLKNVLNKDFIELKINFFEEFTLLIIKN